ncbi:MAG: cupin domain-containing protein, partial [Candidatus Paceibacterota bacterium]
MSGYIANIEEKTEANDYFREVLFTAPHCQLVVMSLNPNEDIGEETHADVDQFLRVERGEGKAVLDGEETS